MPPKTKKKPQKNTLLNYFNASASNNNEEESIDSSSLTLNSNSNSNSNFNFNLNLNDLEVEKEKEIENNCSFVSSTTSSTSSSTSSTSSSSFDFNCNINSNSSNSNSNSLFKESYTIEEVLRKFDESINNLHVLFSNNSIRVHPERISSRNRYMQTNLTPQRATELNVTQLPHAFDRKHKWCFKPYVRYLLDGTTTEQAFPVQLENIYPFVNW